MATTENLVIGEFAALATDRDWRIDWIGNITKARNVHAQYLVDIYLSPVRQDPKEDVKQGHENLPQLAIQSPRVVDGSQQVLIRVGVGYLPLLYIGAVIRAGKVVSSGRPAIAKTVRGISAGSPLLTLDKKLPRFGRVDLGDGLRMVESTEYSVGRKAYSDAAHSHVVAMADIDGIDPYYLLIPCIEIVRFFFCVSSLLSRHLFANGWDGLIWPEGCSTERLPQEVTVGTRRVAGLDEEHVRHLAFLLVDECTQTSVNSICQSLQETNLGRLNKSGIKCTFPFMGVVDMTADVVKIPINNATGYRYFVTRIHTCERPIPFRACVANPVTSIRRVDRDDEDAQTDGETQTHGGGMPRFVVRNRAQLAQSGAATDDAGAPGKNLDPVVLELDEHRFIGLEEIPVSQAPKIEPIDVPQKKPRVVQVQSQTMSTAEPRGASSAAIPLEIISVADEPFFPTKESTVAMLYDAIPFLQERGLRVQKNLPLHLLNFTPSTRRNPSRWATFTTGSDAQGEPKTRSRQLCSIVVRIPNVGSCLVVEIERRLQFLDGRIADAEQFGIAAFPLDPARDSRELLALIATSIVERRGWPAYDKRTKEYECHDGQWIRGVKSTHNDISTSEELAERIQKSFVEKFPRYFPSLQTS